MTDLRSTPAQIRTAMGWNFNSNTTLEALAAWEAYKATPLSPEWAGMEHVPNEKDAFTAGFDAARQGGGDDDEMARVHLDAAEQISNTVLKNEHLMLAHTYSNLANAKAMNGRAL